MIVLLWSELARVRRADYLFRKIAFSDVELGPLQDQFVTLAIDPLFKEMIANTRIVGGSEAEGEDVQCRGDPVRRERDALRPRLLGKRCSVFKPPP